MKKALKIILICVLCLGLLGGGVFAYLKFRKVPPCEVYPAMQWMMSYMPNQTYLYGIVTSDASQIVSKDPDRTVLEILVHPGDVVSVGDPLLRYDAHGTEDLDSAQEDHAADEARYFCMSRPVRPMAERAESAPALDPLASAGK